MPSKYTYCLSDKIDGKLQIASHTNEQIKLVPLSFNSKIDGEVNKNTIRVSIGDNPSNWFNSTSTSTLKIYHKNGDIGDGSGFVQGNCIASSSTNILYDATGDHNGGSNYSNPIVNVSGGSGTSTGTANVVDGVITNITFSNVQNYIPDESLIINIIDINNTNASNADNIFEIGDNINKLIIQKTTSQQIGNISEISIALTPKTTSDKLLLGTNSKPITYIKTTCDNHNILATAMNLVLWY